MDSSPRLIDKRLYQTPHLKTVLIDNFANHEENRPLNEFRDCVSDIAEDFGKKLCEYLGVTITTEQLEDFKEKFYNDNIPTTTTNES